MKTRGRPLIMNSSLENVAIKLAEQGKTDAQIVEIIEISPAAFYEYKKNNPEFRDTIKQCKAEFDDAVVEQALLKRATGMTVKEVQTRVVDGKQTKTIIEKELPPDANSLSLWLRNRKPSDWNKEKQSIQIDYLDNIRHMTVADARRILAEDPFGPTVESEIRNSET